MSSTLASSDFEERSRNSRSGGGGARAGGGVVASPGRDIRRIQGSQYRNTHRIYTIEINISNVKIIILIYNKVQK